MIRMHQLPLILLDELIEKADGFDGVFPEQKYKIVRRKKIIYVE
jgi:hypothetical protein